MNSTIDILIGKREIDKNIINKLINKREIDKEEIINLKNVINKLIKEREIDRENINELIDKNKELDQKVKVII